MRSDYPSSMGIIVLCGVFFAGFAARIISETTPLFAQEVVRNTAPNSGTTAKNPLPSQRNRDKTEAFGVESGKKIKVKKKENDGTLSRPSFSNPSRGESSTDSTRPQERSRNDPYPTRKSVRFQSEDEFGGSEFDEEEFLHLDDDFDSMEFPDPEGDRELPSSFSPNSTTGKRDTKIQQVSGNTRGAEDPYGFGTSSSDLSLKGRSGTSGSTGQFESGTENFGNLDNFDFEGLSRNSPDSRSGADDSLQNPPAYDSGSGSSRGDYTPRAISSRANEPYQRSVSGNAEGFSRDHANISGASPPVSSPSFAVSSRNLEIPESCKSLIDPDHLFHQLRLDGDPVDPNSKVIGRPLTIYEMLQSVHSPKVRSRLLRSYWDLSGAIAKYKIAVNRWNQIAFWNKESSGGTLQGNNPFSAAQKMAESQMKTAELRVIQKQDELSSLLRQYGVYRPVVPANQKEEQLPPIPTDFPLIGAYNTQVNQLVRYRQVPSRATRLDKSIALQKQIIDSKLNELDAAMQYSALVDRNNGGDHGIISSYLQQMSTFEDCVDEVVLYNQMIAEYVGETVGSEVVGRRLMKTFLRLNPEQNDPPLQSRSVPNKGNSSQPERFGARESAVPSRSGFSQLGSGFDR